MSSSRGHLPSHTTPGAVGGQEDHARVRKDSEGTLSMNQALTRKGDNTEQRTVKKQIYCHLAQSSIVIFKLIET